MARVRDPNAGFFRLLGRAVTRKCPRCGSPGVFATWFTMHDNCPSCGFHFEREEGYWLGAMVINTTVTLGLFIVVFVGGILLTWPDPDWGVILAVTIGVNLLIPIVFYPLSKTLWSAMELSWHPLEEHEIIDAMERVEG